MKERPILFSGPMVRAILDGRKTQTRRIVKQQPPPGGLIHPFDGRFILEKWPRCEREMGNFGRVEDLLCPHGQPGDRLWVKETFTTDFLGPKNRIVFRADEPDARCRWKPSIFMRRYMSRITLDITGIRVERLNDISTADAKAEGVTLNPEYVKNKTYGDPDGGWRFEYRMLWESIHGKGSWFENPWVWVIQFPVHNPARQSSLPVLQTSS